MTGDGERWEPWHVAEFGWLTDAVVQRRICRCTDGEHSIEFMVASVASPEIPNPAYAMVADHAKAALLDERTVERDMARLGWQQADAKYDEYEQAAIAHNLEAGLAYDAARKRETAALALLDDSTARIADLERERDALRQGWLEHTQLLDEVTKALEAANALLAETEAIRERLIVSVNFWRHRASELGEELATDSPDEVARLRPPEAPQA